MITCTDCGASFTTERGLSIHRGSQHKHEPSTEVLRKRKTRLDTLRSSSSTSQSSIQQSGADQIPDQTSERPNTRSDSSAFNRLPTEHERSISLPRSHLTPLKDKSTLQRTLSSSSSLLNTPRNIFQPISNSSAETPALSLSSHDGRQIQIAPPQFVSAIQRTLSSSLLNTPRSILRSIRNSGAETPALASNDGDQIQITPLLDSGLLIERLQQALSDDNETIELLATELSVSSVDRYQSNNISSALKLKIMILCMFVFLLIYCVLNK